MKKKLKEGASLEEAVLDMMGSSTRTAARKLIKNLRVTVGGKPQARPDFAVRAGQIVEIVPKGRETGRKAAPGVLKSPQGARRRLGIKILHEDDWIIVLDKPAGLLSIASDKERTRTLYYRVMDYIRESTLGEKRVFIVHRLDRDASGVIVMAKDEPTKRKLQKEWANAQKVYHAVVQGVPPHKTGTIKNHLCENRAKIVYVCDEKKKDAQEAVTHYRVMKEKGGKCLLEVTIETGRKHQIRVHMASSLKCPIVGDDVYGTGKAGTRGIALHSHALSFDHPKTGKRMTIKSPLPTRFRSLVG